AAVGDRLHVVWSGGPDGRIFTSQAFTRDAASESGWNGPVALFASAGSGPRISADLLGRLYAITAVPLNEGRGIALSYSDDGGMGWSEAAVVFDAEAAGWLSVAQPDLSVDEAGRLVAVWLRTPLPGNGPALGLYVARSSAEGDVWTEPELLVEGAMASPRVVATLKGQVLVLWFDSQRGTVGYRLSTDGGATWSLPSQAPGLRDLQAPPAIAPDGAGNVHLAAVIEDSGALALAHSVWDGERWNAEPSLALGKDVQAVAGLGVALDASMGRLELLLSARTLNAEGAAEWGIWHTARAIPIVERVTSAQFARVTPTPEPGPMPTPTPTPRPQVNPDPETVSAPAVALGPLSVPIGAIVGVLLAGFFAVTVVVMARRR
ncbi:MAG: exo-alpha-sialidase, partial [Anaerolineae bacterium]|nr:exo-alpha-sialidase [Anaerolineae bacterium]